MAPAKGKGNANKNNNGKATLISNKNNKQNQQKAGKPSKHQTSQNKSLGGNKFPPELDEAFTNMLGAYHSSLIDAENRILRFSNFQAFVAFHNHTVGSSIQDISEAGTKIPLVVDWSSLAFQDFFTSKMATIPNIETLYLDNNPFCTLLFLGRTSAAFKNWAKGVTNLSLAYCAIENPSELQNLSVFSRLQNLVLTGNRFAGTLRPAQIAQIAAQACRGLRSVTFGEEVVEPSHATLDNGVRNELQRVVKWFDQRITPLHYQDVRSTQAAKLRKDCSGMVRDYCRLFGMNPRAMAYHISSALCYDFNFTVRTVQQTLVPLTPCAGTNSYSDIVANGQVTVDAGAELGNGVDGISQMLFNVASLSQLEPGSQTISVTQLEAASDGVHQEYIAIYAASERHNASGRNDVPDRLVVRHVALDIIDPGLRGNMASWQDKYKDKISIGIRSDSICIFNWNTIYGTILRNPAILLRQLPQISELPASVASDFLLGTK